MQEGKYKEALNKFASLDRNFEKIGTFTAKFKDDITENNYIKAIGYIQTKEIYESKGLI